MSIIPHVKYRIQAIIMLTNNTDIEVGAHTLIKVQFKPPSNTSGAIKIAVIRMATSNEWTINKIIFLLVSLVNWRLFL